MDGWMDGCCHDDNLRILLINRAQALYIVRDYLVCYDNIGHMCGVDRTVYVLGSELWKENFEDMLRVVKEFIDGISAKTAC